MFVLLRIIAVLIISIFFFNKLYADDIPVIVISPGKSIQSYNTVGSSVSVIDGNTIESSQDSFLAGGRYDGLIKKMGGPDYPGCGFAAGVERIRLLGPKNVDLKSERESYFVLIAVGKKNRIKAMEKMEKFRSLTTWPIDFICRDNLSKGLRYASEKKAKYALILGDDEILNNEIAIKELKTRKQKKINISRLSDYLFDPKKIKF